MKIKYQVHKKSDVWILCLHGIQSDSGLFKNLLQRPFFAEYSTLCIDDVGFGDSPKPEDFSYDVQDQAKIIQMVVEEMGIQKLHIIGHSLGGMIGALLLDSLKDKVLSFVNLEGNLVLKDCGLSKTVAGYSFEQFKNVEYEKLKLSNKATATAFYKTSQSIVEWSASEKLLQIFIAAPQKKLFVYGDKNSAKAKVLPASIPRAEISGSGHFMLHDNFQDTALAIERFLTHT